MPLLARERCKLGTCSDGGRYDTKADDKVTRLARIGLVGNLQEEGRSDKVEVLVYVRRAWKPALGKNIEVRSNIRSMRCYVTTSLPAHEGEGGDLKKNLVRYRVEEIHWFMMAEAAKPTTISFVGI